jgi:uncharacterized protein DUF6884
VPAGAMYLGGYHRACRRAAAALTTPDRVLILSALYGFLPLEQVIEPYDLRMGQPGSVTTGRLREQAAELGVDRETSVVLLGGRHYTEAALQVWTHARTPLAGVGGMGHQLQLLARIAAAGRLPAEPAGS